MKKTTLSLLLVSVAGVATAQKPENKRKDPARFESSIAKFEAAEAKNPSPKDAVLFVGSSSIRMWKLDESFPERKTINRGFGGSTLADSIHFLDRIIPKQKPKAIVLYAGDNDMNNGLNAEEVLSDFKKLTDLIAEKLPETPVIFIAIKPSIKRWKLWPAMNDANDRIAEYCGENTHLHYADIAKPMLAGAEGPPDAELFAKDGLHLSDAGYAMWKKVIDSLLK